MKNQRLLSMICEDCGKKQTGWSRIGSLSDIESGKPLECIECNSTNLIEIETLQVG